MNSIKFGVVTVSDTCYSSENLDKSGPKLAQLIQNAYSNGEIICKRIVPDDVILIQDTLIGLCNEGCDVILTTGGTGFAPRDVTPEATKLVIHKEASSVIHGILNKGLEKTPLAMLSRGVCGIREKTLIINLSGSVKAVSEQFDAIKAVIVHAVALIKDEKSDVKLLHEKLQSEFNKKENEENLLPSKVRVNAVAARDRSSPYTMISCSEAHKFIKATCDQTNEYEVVHINDALYRILAEDVKAHDPLPPFPASIKDGYAVKSSDTSLTRIVVNSIVAGDKPTAHELQSGECIRISTGAPVPPGADAVVPVENTKLLKATDDNSQELEISINKCPNSGEEIRQIGSDIAAHSLILSKGITLRAPEIGILATVGQMNVKVYKRPTVGIISTGNELQDPSEPLRPGHIRDSNKYTLLNLLKSFTYNAEDCGIVIDEPNALKYAFEKAFSKYDVVVTTGGVSMGEFDFIKKVLQTDFNAKIHFGLVNMKPGKPMTFATCSYKGKLKTIFGLPGNPVSATVTCLLFVIPALRHCENREDTLYPLIDVYFEPTKPIYSDGRPEYHRVTLEYGSRVRAISTGNQISSRLNSFVHADGLLIYDSKKENAMYPCYLLRN